jgi:dipeptide/tripeptide permease
LLICCGVLDEDNSHLSIYYQIPQGIGIGFSQLFAMVASCEYAYFAAPRSAQSLFMSLHFCSIGIASFIGAAYVYLFPTPLFDLNFSVSEISNSFVSLFDVLLILQCQSVPEWQWSLYIYFFNLACLQLIFIVIFIVCHNKFGIIKLNPQYKKESVYVR